MKKEKVSKGDLNNLYHIEGYGADDIGKMYGICGETIIRWMKSYELPIRNSNDACRTKRFRTKQRVVRIGKNNSFFGCIHTKKELEKQLEYWTLERRMEESEANLGENNPRFGHEVSDKIKERLRIASTGYRASDKTLKKMADAWTPKMKEERSNAYTGKNNPNYIDGMSNRGYPQEFNERLKKIIRNKFNNCDYISGLHKDIINFSQNLDVHHIDYDKLNISEGNLIPLSKSNHTKTNGNRFFWERLFKYSLNYEEEYYGGNDN